MTPTAHRPDAPPLFEPLAEQELAAYVDHRLRVGRAGGSPLAGAGDLARALSEWDGAASGGGASFNREALAAVWHWSGGLPRVVNLLCDRSLEEAYARQVRTIDADVVGAAARALQLNAAAVGAPEVLGPPAGLLPRKTASRSLVAAATIAVIAGAAATAWFLSQRTAPPAANNAPAPSINRPPPAAAPPPARTPAPVVTPAVEPAAPRVPPATSAAAAAPTAAQAGFEIVVASFRTEARAAAVAAQVTAAALPVRQREAAGWQQVIAGPFATRDAADTARAQLERAGLGGTRIVPAQQ